jgi:IS30 family transposase
MEVQAVLGTLERDLLPENGNSHIATLVERHTRYVMLVEIAGKDTEAVAMLHSNKLKSFLSSITCC